MDLEKLGTTLELVWLVKSALEDSARMGRKRRDGLAADLLDAVIAIKEATGLQ